MPAVLDAPKLEQAIFNRFVFNFSGAKTRYETLEGKQYLVVPMVMLTEGVHAGSLGPLYYPREELRKTPVVWNHKPLVIYHPQQNGQGVSACSPEVLETRKVGLVMNTLFDGRLKSEAWFDEDKLKKVDKRVWDAIQNGKKVEVSTGLFTDNEHTAGEWKGEKYVAIARNYRPDHLAILPDQKGACSIEDGAGLLQNAAVLHGNQSVLSANKKTGLSVRAREELMAYNNRWPKSKRNKLPSSDFAGPHESFPIKTQKDVKSAAKLAGHADDPDAVRRRIRSIAKRKGLKVPKSLQTNTAVNNASFSHGTIRRAINEALRGKVKTATGLTGPGDDHVVHDIYDDFFISSKYDGNGMKHYMTPYEMEPQSGSYTGKDSDRMAPPKAKITGPAKEVKQVISWRDLQGNLVANSNEEEVTSKQQQSTRERFINELRVMGYRGRGEVMMLQRMSLDNLALLVQQGHLRSKAIINADAVGAGPAASTGGVPAGGSANPAVKTFAQRKARTSPRKPAKSAKRKKEVIY